MKKRHFLKEQIIYTVILLVFILLAILIGIKHEPWADESQAWLIARDTSLKSLFFQYLHSDGHPALWHIILKIFQFMGLKYKYFFLIPIIFSSLGVYLFLFKSKYSLLIKVLFPFTYFVFYQYTIVARGYCLLLLLLCLTAIMYEKRFEKPYIYTLLLILLINSEAYTYLFAGSLFILYIYDYFKNKNLKNQKDIIICFIIIAFSFILTLLYSRPISSNTVYVGYIKTFYISDAFITPKSLSVLLRNFISWTILCVFFFAYKKDNKIPKFFEAILLLTLVFLFCVLGYCSPWHIGIFFLLTIFIIWIQKMETNKTINYLLIISCLIQCTWTISSSIYDFNNAYSGAKSAAAFIKKYDYNKLKIYGYSFYENAINPYFSKNIFNNWDHNISFFYLNTENIYYTKSLNVDTIINDNVDIFIYSYYKLNDKKLLDLYNKYEFKGFTFVENKKYENQTYWIYVLKSIDKQKQ